MGNIKKECIEKCRVVKKNDCEKVKPIEVKASWVITDIDDLELGISKGDDLDKVLLKLIYEINYLREKVSKIETKI